MSCGAHCSPGSSYGTLDFTFDDDVESISGSLRYGQQGGLKPRARLFVEVDAKDDLFERSKSFAVSGVLPFVKCDEVSRSLNQSGVEHAEADLVFMGGSKDVQSECDLPADTKKTCIEFFLGDAVAAASNSNRV